MVSQLQQRFEMDLRQVACMLVLSCFWLANGHEVFQVHSRFRGQPRNLTAWIAQDHHRQCRFPSALELNLIGNGKPFGTGLYYTKLGLGSPPKEYYMLVDTGSDISWVNCIDCEGCPRKSDLDIKLTLYDPRNSKTSSLVPCDGDFCTQIATPNQNCKRGLACAFNLKYLDGTSTNGFYVKDYLTFSQVNGDFHTKTAKSSVIFGCGIRLSGELASSHHALDGILGFGQANSSVLSQLAATRNVKKVFSHCLDNIHGGGIFAIGEVMEPKVNTTPLVPKMEHYTLVLKNIEVGKDVLGLPSNTSDSGRWRRTIIDSGTTLAYLPDMIYDQLITKVMAWQPGLKLFEENLFTCFLYESSVNDGFPVVRFHFEDSLSLIVNPHDYLFQSRDNCWCVGWQKTEDQFTFSNNQNILLGELVLSNKLVVYDVENMAIGWTEFNCSSSIKVKDEATGTVYTVGAHDLSSASTVIFGGILTYFLLLVVTLNTSID